MELLSAHAFLFAVASCVVYCIVVAVYRLHFSPIAKFPGPKLAALTLWFEFYYDVVKGGQYTWEIERLHEKYGMSPRPALQLLPRSMLTPNVRSNRPYQSL